MNKQKGVIFFCLLMIVIVPLVSLNAFSDDSVDELIENALEQSSNNNTKAIEYFDRVLEMEPNNIKALYGKGSVLLLENDLDTSLKYFDRVLEMEPEHVSALVNKGVVLGQKKQFDESLIFLNKAIEMEPNNINALMNKAVLFLTQKTNWQQIIELLDKVLEINPNNIQAFQNKKIAYTEMPTKPFDGIIQTIVRDKDGNLLGYLESDSIRATEYLPPDILDKWISLNSTKIVKEENKDILVFVRAINGYNDNDARMRTGLAIAYTQEHQNEKLELPIILARQNGLFQQDGDYFDSTWQLVVPKELITK